MKTLTVVILFVASAFAQLSAPKPVGKPHKKQKSQKVVVDAGPPDAYLFTDADHAQMRDLQYQGDQLEIANKRLQLEIDAIAAKDPDIAKRRAQIADNMAQQKKILDEMLSVAARVAQQRKIDLNLYQLDAVQMKFVRKGATTK